MAIKTAGYVSADANTSDVQVGLIKVISPSELGKLRNNFLVESLHIAKVPDKPILSDLNSEQVEKRIKTWSAQARAAERAASDWGNKGLTGKKGKNGGRVNIEDRKKLSGVKGN